MDIRMRLDSQREVALTHGAEVALGPDEQPEEAWVDLRCDCGRVTASRAPVAFESHDPDRYDRHEFTYASAHAAHCSHCARPLSRTFRFSVTKYRDSGRRVLVVDTPGGTGGDGGGTPIEWF